MALGEVVAGDHRRVRLAQRLRKLGFALEADAERVGAELGEGEHLAGDLEHRRVGAERKRLLGAPEGEAVIAKLCGIHLDDLEGLAEHHDFRLVKTHAPGGVFDTPGGGSATCLSITEAFVEGPCSRIVDLDVQLRDTPRRCAATRTRTAGSATGSSRTSAVRRASRSTCRSRSKRSLQLVRATRRCSHPLRTELQLAQLVLNAIVPASDFVSVSRSSGSPALMDWPTALPRHECSRASGRARPMPRRPSPSTASTDLGPLPGTWVCRMRTVWRFSNLDARAHDHGLFAWEFEVFGGVGGEVGGGEEELFAPAAHAGRVAAVEFDL